MRRLKINNTEYRFFGRFNGKDISVRVETQLNPYCWDSTFHNISMSWRRFKKFVKSKEVIIA